MAEKTVNNEPIATDKANDVHVEVQKIDMKFSRPDNFGLYFVNNVQVSAGQTGEVQIFFGQVVSASIGEGPESIRAKQEVGIVMTLAEYRRMLKVFQRHLPVLERDFAKHVEDEAAKSQ